MRPQATVSNTLSDSIIFPSVRPVVRSFVRTRAFFDLMSVCLVVRGLFLTRINASRHWTPALEIKINKFPIWGSSIAMHFTPNWGPEDPSGVQSSLCIHLYVRPSVMSSASIFDYHTCGPWNLNEPNL